MIWGTMSYEEDFGHYESVNLVKDYDLVIKN